MTGTCEKVLSPPRVSDEVPPRSPLACGGQEAMCDRGQVVLIRLGIVIIIFVISVFLFVFFYAAPSSPRPRPGSWHGGRDAQTN